MKICNIIMPFRYSFRPGRSMKERQTTQTRTKKRSNGADNKISKPVTTVEYPPQPPTFLVQLPPMGRSSRPQSSDLNMQRTKKEPASKSFYAHSNLSGDLLPQEGSEPTLTLAPLQLPSFRPHQQFLLKDSSVTSHSPALSLLRSRRKLWRKDRLNAILSSIPEREEDNQSVGKLAKHEHSNLTDTYPQSPVPAEVEAVEFTDFRGFAQISSGPSRFPSMDPCPPFGYDEEADSSSSDEDLDAYEFDLSNCHPSPLAGLDGVTNTHMESTLFKDPKVKRSTVSFSFRLSVRSQADPDFEPAEP